MTSLNPFLCLGDVYVSLGLYHMKQGWKIKRIGEGDMVANLSADLFYWENRPGMLKKELYGLHKNSK